MPPRNEIDLDPVTLHNMALINMDSEPTKGFEKLNFLLQANPCPPETLGNLLLLYIKHDFDDIAADLLAQCQHFAHELIDPVFSPSLYILTDFAPKFVKRFIEAVLLRKSSVEDSFKKLDEMGNEIIEDLRKLTKCVQEARQSRDDETIKRAVMEYDECIDLYVPSLPEINDRQICSRGHGASQALLGHEQV
jgi:tetratricopeptide repeat protein 30